MVEIDPVTRQRFQRMPHTGDMTYDLTGDTAISEETVPVIGDWEDYTGSEVVSTKTLMYGAGQENELQGTDAAIDNKEDINRLNEVGDDAATTRRRTIKRYVK